MRFWLVVYKLINAILAFLPVFRQAKDLAKAVVVAIEQVAKDQTSEEKKQGALKLFEEAYTKAFGYKPSRFVLKTISWFIDLTVKVLNKRFGKRWLEYIDEVKEFLDTI